MLNSRKKNAMNFWDQSKLSRAPNVVEFTWTKIKMLNRDDREGNNRKEKITQDDQQGSYTIISKGKKRI